ncbi:hypothetical protein HPB50_029061 [Hyalomma asiaticum]|nr:hypothetical protein HPB50_029061 [Hyalomma asiaticum]
MTNPSTPTRAGTSSTKDSAPDLSFTRNTSATTWQNTFEDLGSDHYIIAIRVQGGPRKQTGRQLKMVDWTRFRKSRENQVQPIDDIERWTHTLKQDVNNVTRTVPPEAHLEQIDSRLLHMWEAKQSLKKRRAVETCGKLLQRATPRAFVWFAARPESSDETRASLSPRFPPCTTEPSDESYVAPSAADSKVFSRSTGRPGESEERNVVVIAMNNAVTTTNTTNPPVVLQQPREPPPFHR